jgi:hypothetical protein
VKKLVAQEKTFKDKLVDDEVYDLFSSTILTKAKKIQKPEVRSLVDEFSRKIALYHTGEEEDPLIANMVVGDHAE